MGIRESSAFLLLWLLFLPSLACPPDCACKWKGGKQWVECVAKGLRTFPPMIDSGTQVSPFIQLHFNSFHIFHFHLFDFWARSALSSDSTIPFVGEASFPLPFAEMEGKGKR